MRRRVRGEARPSGGVPVGVVVVLVLALVGVGAFALTRDGGAAGPSSSGGAATVPTDEELVAMVDAEAESRVVRLELQNDAAGIARDPEAGRNLRALLRGQLREELLPLLRERVRTAPDALEARLRAREVLSSGRR